MTKALHCQGIHSLNREKPNCPHTTPAALAAHWSSDTVPQVSSKQTSTRPELTSTVLPFVATSLTSPSLQRPSNQKALKCLILHLPKHLLLTNTVLGVDIHRGTFLPDVKPNCHIRIRFYLTTNMANRLTGHRTANTSILSMGAVSSDRVIATVYQCSLRSSASHIIQVDWTTPSSKASTQDSSSIWKTQQKDIELTD